ncbi:MAG: universal stress protein [Ilumatobacteraceae bacterium]
MALERDDAGARAARWASRFADDLQVGIAVVTPLGRDSAERAPEDLQEFVDDAAGAVSSWLSERGMTCEDVEVVDGDFVDGVAARARVDDLVVLAVDDEEGFTGWALGSDAHKLAHELPCPMVVVPPSAVLDAGAPVVVGVDGTTANRATLDWAASLASALHRPVGSVHATDPVYDTFDNAGNYGVQEAMARLESAADHAPIVEAPGEPDEVVREVAHDERAYLTVIGTRDMGSLGGRLLGSTADHLLHEPPGALAIITHDALG